MLAHLLDDRTELRLFEEHHADELFAAVERNRAHLRVWLPWVDATRSPDDIRAFIRKCLEEFARGQTIALGIWHDGAIAGSIGTHDFSPLNRTCSIGYWLDEQCQGHGIVTRSCQALMRHLFEERGVHRIEIRCATGNASSCAIPRKLGFREEGILKDAMWLSGSPLDVRLFAQTRPEWEQRSL